MKINKSLAAQLAELERKPAALDRKVIGELLSRKWNIKLIFPESLRLCGEV